MAGAKVAFRSTDPGCRTFLSTNRLRPGSRVTRSLQSPSVSVTSYRSSPGDGKPVNQTQTSHTIRKYQRVCVVQGVEETSVSLLSYRCGQPGGSRRRIPGLGCNAAGPSHTQTPCRRQERTRTRTPVRQTGDRK